MTEKNRRVEHAVSAVSNKSILASHDSNEAALETSTLTAERILALENIGFCWDARISKWYSQFQELQLHVQKNGNTYVERKKNRSLHVWVKCQRNQYKRMIRGESSNMTGEKARLLTSIGFDFQGKNEKKGNSEHKVL